MTIEQNDNLYDEDGSDERVGNGPTDKPNPTKMENISSVISSGKSGKVIVVTGAAILLVIALILVSFSSKKKVEALPESISGVTVGETPQLGNQGSQALGGTAQYKEMVNQVNQSRVDEAKKSGGSVQPLTEGVERSLVTFKSAQELEKEAKIAANLEANKAAATALATTQTTKQQPLDQQSGQGQAAQDAAHVEMLSNAQLAMSALFSKRRAGMETFAVSTPEKTIVASMNSGTQNANVSTSPTAKKVIQKTLISAGAIYAAKLDTAINTDIAGDFIATLVTGPYAGAKLIGTSKRSGDTATMQFKAMSLPDSGVSVPVNAYALDATTLEASTATDVDRKLLVKYGIKPLVSGIAAVGQALSVAGTSVLVNGSAVATSTPKPSSEDIRNIIAAAAAKQISQDSDALNTTPTVRVAPGTIVGVMFTSDVLYSAN